MNSWSTKPAYIIGLVFMLLMPTGLNASEALSEAIKRGDNEVVNAELANNADPNFITASGYAALSYAVLKGEADIVQLLIDAGADLNQPSRVGSNDRALSIAAQTGADNSRVIKALLAAGADAEFTSGEWVMTPISLAVLSHKTINALTFIDAGVDLVAPDKVGDSVLHAAIYQRNMKVVHALLSNGVSPAVLNDAKQNAFQFSKKMGPSEIRVAIANRIFSKFL